MTVTCVISLSLLIMSLTILSGIIYCVFVCLKMKKMNENEKRNILKKVVNWEVWHGCRGGAVHVKI